MRAQTFLTWQPENSRQVGEALRDAGEGRLLVVVGLVSGVPQMTVTMRITVQRYFDSLMTKYSDIDEIFASVILIVL